MKRASVFALLFSLVSLLVVPAHAADAPKKSDDKSPGVALATAVTTVTGVAISPLLGTGAYGAYQYFSADSDEEKAKLPWFAQPSFFITAFLLVGIVAFKDSLGAALPPGMKKPLDVLETVENKVSGLVAAGAVIPITMSTLSSVLGSSDSAAALTHSSGFAMLHLGALDFSWLLNLLTIPFGAAVFVFVWMASHALNVLILLSPWGAVDAVLKSIRVAVLGLLTLSAQLKPEYAAVFSLLIIVLSYFIAGWSFRLTIFGSLFCWDFFTRRKHRFRPDASANKVFSGSDLKGVPVRTYGHLIQEPQNGRTVFTYKPWLILPAKTVTVQWTQPVVAKGLFFSTLRNGERTVAILPPRYRGHEEALVKIYAIEGGVQPAGLRKAWSLLRELFSGSAATAQAV